MTRTEVRDLKWAHYGPVPSFIPQTRYRGSRAKGIAFEKKIVKTLRKDYPDLLSGQWIYFEDVRGPGVAQPDILIPSKDSLHLVECKLSYRKDAEVKIRGVYGTLLEFIHPGVRLHFTQCFHNWRDYSGETISLDQLLMNRTEKDYKLCQM